MPVVVVKRQDAVGHMQVNLSSYGFDYYAVAAVIVVAFCAIIPTFTVLFYTFESL